MYKVADLMLAASPTMCMPNVHVHVVHDLVANGSYSRSDITYHGFPPAPWRPPDVQRFVLYAQLLRRIAWDCAFAIDISDVNMLNVPPCHALPQRLVIGSDSNDNWFLKWLRKAARINGLLGTLHAPFEAMLNGSSSQAGLPFRPANVGVVGGCRGTFGPILRSMASRFAAHWPAAMPRPLSAASDMVLWNEEAVRLTNESTPPLTGFPDGPVTMPMYGGSAQGTCLARFFRNASGRQVNPCRNWWFNASRGLFWFAHKPVFSWLTTLMAPASFRYVERLPQWCLQRRLHCVRCVRSR